VVIGGPGGRYPMPWSMQTWLTGVTASVEDPGDSEAFASELAGFILDVRALDTEGRAFDGTNRGGDLRFDEAWMAHCFEQSHGIVDVGGFAPADPALDLVAGWHLLEPATRRRLREELGCDDLEWERGKAWALQQVIGAAWCYRWSNPEVQTMGFRTLERILADGS
jgi:aminoglycoside phosphotransferase (APT) family kinase protein